LPLKEYLTTLVPKLLLAILLLPSFPLLADQGDATTGDSATIDEKGVLIHSQNYHDFFELIAPELIPLVEKEGLVLPAHASLSKTWESGETWLSTPSDDSHSIDQTGSIKNRSLLGDGYPFKATNPIEALWNMESHRWRFAFSSVKYELFNFDSALEPSEFTGKVERVYPRRISSQLPDQLFRERTSLSLPGTLDPLLYLSFRLFGDHEDFLWIRSPALKQNRRATPSNRGDAIFNTSISLDDFFGFSSKVERFDFSELTDREVLLAFSKRTASQLTKIDSLCYGIGDDELQPSLFEEGMHWNFLSRNKPGSPGWSPGRIVFIPRQALRFELTPRDPFAAYGRQVLYLDAETHVPALKFIYSRSGELSKSIISAFGVAEAKDQESRHIFWDYSIAFNHTESKVTIIDTFEHRYCEVPEDKAQELLKIFDPARLDQFNQSGLDALVKTEPPKESKET